MHFRKRKDLDYSKCKRYEQCVQDVLTSISQMAHPFDVDQEHLINLASGVELENTVSDRLLSAEQLVSGSSQNFLKTTCFPTIRIFSQNWSATALKRSLEGGNKYRVAKKGRKKASK